MYPEFAILRHAFPDEQNQTGNRRRALLYEQSHTGILRRAFSDGFWLHQLHQKRREVVIAVAAAMVMLTAPAQVIEDVLSTKAIGEVVMSSTM